MKIKVYDRMISTIWYVIINDIVLSGHSDLTYINDIS